MTATATASGAVALVTEAELVAWGRRIGREVETPVVVGLRGPLGAGKSVLARAVARGAGVRSPLPSPSFNLLFRYHGRRGVDVVHVDLFRIENADEVWELGWGELGGPSELVLIEWPERAESLLPGDRWDVILSPPPGQPWLREVAVVRRGRPPELPLPAATHPAGKRAGGRARRGRM